MGGFGSGRRGGQATTAAFIRWSWKDGVGKALNKITPDTRVVDDIQGPFTSRWTSGWQKHEVETAQWELHLCGHGGHFLRFIHCNGTQDVSLVWQSRHLGGGHWMMICPRTGRTCTVLYKPIGRNGYGFGSRHGWRMHYTCQHEDKQDQATQQLLKIRQRLGDKTGVLEWDTCDLPKPKGMHWRTFDELQAKAERYEAVRMASLAAVVERLEKRTGETWGRRFL